MLFQVLAGLHAQDGRIYKKGDFVECDTDLAKTFRNKFMQVSRPEVPKASAQPAKPEVVVFRQPVPVELPTRPKPTQNLAPAVAATTPVTAATPAPATVPAPADNPIGLDVTKRFPIAVDQDYKVFKSKGLLYVYDADDLSKPINAEGLVHKEDVTKAIEAHLT
jgi:hypothetical protein